MEQQVAWQISIWLSALVGVAFIFVVGRSTDRHPYDQVQPRAYQIRGRLFWVLVVLGFGIGATTLTRLPYPDQAKAAAATQVVNAVGHQWYWDLSATEVSLESPVEFRVTSADVNHGFGIYDQSLRLVTQTQAMPGYTSVLRHTFDSPGVYKIMCLEYCGLSHHDMPEEIVVRATALSALEQ